MSTVYSLPAAAHPRSPYEYSAALGLDLGPPSPDPIVPYHSRSPPISPISLITPVHRQSTGAPLTTPVDPVLVDATGSPRVSVRRLVVDYEEHDRQVDEEAERERSHHHARSPGLAPARRLRSGSTSGSSTSSQHGHGRTQGPYISRSRAPVNAEGPYVSGSINHSKSGRRYSRAEMRDQVGVDGVSPPSPPKSTPLCDKHTAQKGEGEEPNVSALVPPQIAQDQDQIRPVPSPSTSALTPTTRIPTPSRSKSATTVPSFTSSSSTPSSRGSSGHPSPSIPTTPPHPAVGLPHAPSPASSVDAREPRESIKRNSSFSGFGSLRGLRSLRKKSKDSKDLKPTESVLHFDHPEPILEDTKHRPQPLDLKKDPGYRSRISAYDFLASESPLDPSPLPPVSTSPTKKRMSLGNIFHRKDHKEHKDKEHNHDAHEHKEPRKSLSIPLIERRPSAQYIRPGTVSSAVAAVEKAPVQYVIDASGVRAEPITHTHTVVHTVSTPPSPPTTPPQVADIAKVSILPVPSRESSLNPAPPARTSSLSQQHEYSPPRDIVERETDAPILTQVALTDEPATSDSICSDTVEHSPSPPQSPLPLPHSPLPPLDAPFILISTPPTEAEIPIGEALALEPPSPETQHSSPSSVDRPVAEEVTMSTTATSVAVETTSASVAAEAAAAPDKSAVPVVPAKSIAAAAESPAPTTTAPAAPAPAPAPAPATSVDRPAPTVEVTVKTTAPTQKPAELAPAPAPAPAAPVAPAAAITQVVQTPAPTPAVATAPVAAVIPIATPAAAPAAPVAPAPVVAAPVTVVPAPLPPLPAAPSTPAPATKSAPRTPDSKPARSAMPPTPHKPATPANPAPSDRITEKITTVEVSIPAGTPAEEVERIMASTREETTPTPTPKKSPAPAPGSKAGIKPITMGTYSDHNLADISRLFQVYAHQETEGHTAPLAHALVAVVAQGSPDTAFCLTESQCGPIEPTYAYAYARSQDRPRPA